MVQNSSSALTYTDSCIKLLKSLIAEPSFSGEEGKAADIWEKWLFQQGAEVKRVQNNIYALSTYWNDEKPVLLLNSHMDTVKPSPAYTRDPFTATEEDGRIFGLGANDAGASGVTLATTFLTLKDRRDLPVNLILGITASEENMGEKGMRTFLTHLKEKNIYPDMAIVGEPTSLKPAIAERGLVVLDAIVEGKSGHAARNEGINAIYRAIDDIDIIRKIRFPRVSKVLGRMSVNVTMINAGTQHNVIPAECRYVVDVRTTDAYPNEMIARLLTAVTKHSSFTPRSTRVKPSVLPINNSLYRAFESLGLTPFVSPTTSDMALMWDIPSLKIGPGESSRSHSADEFVYIDEIKDALDLYPRLILNL